MEKSSIEGSLLDRSCQSIHWGFPLLPLLIDNGAGGSSPCPDLGCCWWMCGASVVCVEKGRVVAFLASTVLGSRGEWMSRAAETMQVTSLLSLGWFTEARPAPETWNLVLFLVMVCPCWRQEFIVTVWVCISVPARWTPVLSHRVIFYHPLGSNMLWVLFRFLWIFIFLTYSHKLFLLNKTSINFETPL